jgi:triosephosphate isomerase
MLRDIGSRYCILGHSERRTLFGETDKVVNAKVKAVLATGLIPIVCVGESLEERESGRTEAVVTEQVLGSLAGISADDLAKIVVAYEPVWAIGTGKVATPQQAQDVHALVRSLLARLSSPTVADKIRIQYGGSVKPDNAAELAACPDIDGALVGGASLKADDFLAIAKAFG